MNRLSVLALALALASPLPLVSGEANYEWGAVFDVTGINKVQWVSQKVREAKAISPCELATTPDTLNRRRGREEWEMW